MTENLFSSSSILQNWRFSAFETRSYTKQSQILGVFLWAVVCSASFCSALALLLLAFKMFCWLMQRLFSKKSLTRYKHCPNPLFHELVKTLSQYSNASSYLVESTLGDPFVLESNQSGHPSSVSGDRIARCKRWIEREILKPSRLLIAFSMMFWLPRKKHGEFYL